MKGLPPQKIASQEVFDANFGMATTMGKDGRPTEIDFNRQYVISVALAETDLRTEIIPLGLKKTAEGNIEFSYQVKQGEKMSYTTAPSLLIIVDKQYDGNLVLNAI